MANVKTAYGTATSLTITGLSSLASAAYTASSTGQVDNTTNLYLDYLVELNVTVGTVSGNTQIVVFAVASVDGSNYEDTSQDANMALLGTIYTPTNTTAYRGKAMSVAAAFGGVVPPKFSIVVKNDSGAALTAGTAQILGCYQTVV